MNRFFFFFQAEDGIRDKLVTGVQTCALPIWSGAISWIAQRCSRCRLMHVVQQLYYVGDNLWGKETQSRAGSGVVVSPCFVSFQTRCRMYAQGTIWHGRAGRQRARDRCEVVPGSPDSQAAIAGPSRARAPSRGEAVLASARGRGCMAALLGAKWWSWIGSSVPAVPGSSLITSTPVGRSSRPSFSEGTPAVRRTQACALRN